MTKEREQFEEMFALIAKDPFSWLEHAQTMRAAAQPVLQSLLGILHEPQTRPGVRLQKLAYVRGYMLLTGFAFENLLKAIAAKCNLLRVDPGTAHKATPKLTFDARLSARKGRHSLTRFARDLGLALPEEEMQYLKRLEEYIHWGGRYPVPMKADVYAASYSAMRLSFATAYPKLGDALFDKLVSHHFGG
ncbi:MAG: hypothetical protein HYU29_01100 [Chloroflexi bacterium]|nr:hypothetical protein [Chloroflexota bacterium]